MSKNANRQHFCINALTAVSDSVAVVFCCCCLALKRKMLAKHDTPHSTRNAAVSLLKVSFLVICILLGWVVGYRLGTYKLGTYKNEECHVKYQEKKIKINYLMIIKFCNIFMYILYLLTRRWPVAHVSSSK